MEIYNSTMQNLTMVRIEDDIDLTDIQKLKQLYARFTARQIAERMGRSYNLVRNQIRLLSLRKRANVANKEDRNPVFQID